MTENPQSLVPVSPGLAYPAQLALRMVLDTLPSEHSRRAYSRALTGFLGWCATTGAPEFNKALVVRYAAELRGAGLSASTINQRLSAIRKLATEAADNGAIPPHIASGICAVRGERQEGTRLGNWLNRQAAQALLDEPDPSTLKGLRDRALLAVMLGCGLRRAEVASLQFEHVQQREGRWVVVDLLGKRNKLRSVPMPAWTRAAIVEWAEAAGLSAGAIFRPVNRGGRITGERMTAQAVRDVVKLYCSALGIPEVAPHDLRRTFAKLALKGGAQVSQIQLSLGHSSMATTERYLGVEQDLTDAPCDHLGLRLD